LVIFEDKSRENVRKYAGSNLEKQGMLTAGISPEPAGKAGFLKNRINVVCHPQDNPEPKRTPAC
jgi:hypothetical protein